MPRRSVSRCRKSRSIWRLPSSAARSFPGLSAGSPTANDRLEPDQMVAASSSLMLAYGLGAILGPVTVGQAMQHLGPPGYFVYLAAAHLLIGLFALWRMIRRPA